MGRRKDHKPGGKQFMDGFDSFAANLGLSQDNLLGKSGYAPGKRLTPVELEDMYRTSWVVGRTVEVVAEDMVRCGLDLQTQMEAGDIDALVRAFRGNGIPGRLTDAIKWARLYGGALAVMLIDGQDMATPLDMDSITQGNFRGLHVLDRHLVRVNAKRRGHLPRDARGPVEPRIALDARQLENVGHGLRPIHQFLLAVRQLHLVELGLEHFVDGARLQQRRATR